MTVRELLLSKKKWTRGTCARRKGTGQLATEKNDSYCILGAIIFCYGFAGIEEPYNKVKEAVGRPQLLGTMIRQLLLPMFGE